MKEWTLDHGKHVIGSFLDISGAFDNVRWATLIDDMKTLRCSTSTTAMALSYLSNRSATYRLGGTEKTVNLTRGCPQGSKFGPRLWVMTMDPLLKEAFPPDTKLVAYADDIALLAAGNTRNEVIGKTEKALTTITEWANRRGLRFSKEKSVMIPLKGGLVPGFTAAFDGGRIRSVSGTKYLGLQIGENFTFKEHASRLLESSSDVFSRLKSIRKSKWGVSSALALIIYRAVYIPRISYGANLWYPTMDSKEHIRKMESAQRRVLLGVTGAYRTVSTRALQVLAGTLPIHLQIEHNIRIHNGMDRKESETIGIEQWQDIWNNTTKGRWTFSFLPDIRLRLYTPIPFDHYIAQMVTGHGDFNSKLNGFKLVDSPQCRCGYADDTAEHVLWSCTKADIPRLKLKESLLKAGIRWPCEPKDFATSRAAWTALGRFSKEVLMNREKEKQEKELQTGDVTEQDEIQNDL